MFRLFSSSQNNVIIAHHTQSMSLNTKHVLPLLLMATTKLLDGMASLDQYLSMSHKKALSKTWHLCGSQE